MKTDSIYSDEEKLANKYDELTKSLFEANLTHMHYLLKNPEIDAIVQEARKVLKIPKNGRKPNTPKAYHKEMSLLFEKHRSNLLPILLYTTTLEERGVLYEYVDKIIHDFNVYQHFKDSLADYIIHNIVSAPTHNVGLKSNLDNIGRNVLPDIHFFRSPYGNDWEIAKILLYRYQKALPPKFKTSYRGKKQLKKHLKILKEVSDRNRSMAVVNEGEKETYKIRNEDLAFEYFKDVKKVGTVKKTLNRDRKRIRELAKPAR